MAYKIAHLDPGQTVKLQDLEDKLGVCALALEPGLKLAELEGEDLGTVQELEEELGVTLIIYREC
mgnify:CR=1 FL=1